MKDGPFDPVLLIVHRLMPVLQCHELRMFLVAVGQCENELVQFALCDGSSRRVPRHILLKLLVTQWNRLHGFRPVRQK